MEGPIEGAAVGVLLSGVTTLTGTSDGETLTLKFMSEHCPGTSQLKNMSFPPGLASLAVKV
jgi:hypothetical protein